MRILLKYEGDFKKYFTITTYKQLIYIIDLPLLSAAGDNNVQHL